MRYSDEDRGPVFNIDENSYVFARPRVCGRNGKETAHGVQVVLTGLERIDGDLPPLSRLVLGRPLKWSDVESNQAEVPPGVCRAFDLVHVRRLPRDAPTKEANYPGALDVFPKRPIDGHRIPEGVYDLAVALVARDLPSQFFSFRVTIVKPQRDGGLLDESVLAVQLQE
ncbi:MAG: hypothetical protein QOJ29_2581 [Thermoleophilaceae bacterium]|jgi:hypothetical protein|nr:hypothetical protein [Thermoleophilaceae bacterium]